MDEIMLSSIHHQVVKRFSLHVLQTNSVRYKTVIDGQVNLHRDRELRGSSSPCKAISKATSSHSGDLDEKKQFASPYYQYTSLISYGGARPDKRTCFYTFTAT